MKQGHTLIHHFLEESARSYPNKVALVHDGVRTTYGEVNRAANKLAHWFISHGADRGDRVALLLENSLEYVVSYYGVLKAGMVTVPLSTDLKPGGLKALVAELEAKFMISSTKFERLLRTTDLSGGPMEALILKLPKMDWTSFPSAVHSWDDVIGVGSGPPMNGKSDMGIDGSEMASIVYTSGSRGEPKGVMLSHRNIVSNVQSICEYLRLTDLDIQMVVLPFYYVMGKSLLNTHFAVGGTVVINNRFAFSANVINQMIDEQVTGFSGVPSTYAYLLYRSPLAKFRDRLGSLRYCSQAGGHMASAIKRELRRVLPEHTKIYVMYGATEASARLTYLDPERLEEKISSIGKPIPGVTLRVLGMDGREVAPGQVGELVGSGPNIMLGYWKDKKGSEEAVDKNGYHTGDLGYRDEEGFFYLTGRKDDLVKVGGHRVNLQEVEDALMETELVLEAAVLGIPDKLLGRKLVAFACPKKSDCSKELILGRCAARLPKHKMPVELSLLRSLPKTANGKIDKKALMEDFEARRLES